MQVQTEQKGISMFSQNDVLQYVEEEGVKFIRLAYYDLFGIQRNVSIMPVQLKKAFEKGITIDGAQIFGNSTDGEDLVIKPDASTMILLPWRSMENGVIHMVCDLYHIDGRKYKPDTRTLLKCALDQAHDLDLNLLMASKFEFYLFELDEKGKRTNIPFDQGSYMDVAPLDSGENIRREICLLLEEMGLDPHKSFHQLGPGQNEIDFHFSEPLDAADEASLFKWIVRTTANSNGLYADFSPNPLQGEPGSAMHVQIRFLPECIDKQSAFIAGLLNYLPDVQLFLCPSAASYTRLAYPTAPQRFNFSDRIRNVMVRIPPLSHDVLEVRLPDAQANPYLTFALVLFAGMEGIRQELKIENIPAKKAAANLEEARILADQSVFVEHYIDPAILQAYKTRG